MKTAKSKACRTIHYLGKNKFDIKAFYAKIESQTKQPHN